MAARPIWRGQIRLALVSIPIELFPATRSAGNCVWPIALNSTASKIRTVTQASFIVLRL